MNLRADGLFQLAHRFLFVLVSLFGIGWGNSCSRAENGELVDSAIATLKPDVVEQFPPQIRDLVKKVRVESITYMSDGLKVRGYLAHPAETEQEKLPCVIVNRGGNREFGAFTDERAAAWLGQIASWGYVVVASQYRGNAGGEGQEEFGGKDVNDVLNLIPLLQSLPDADATRIGMYGWSRGGMMTYQALARTDKIAAAIVGGGMSDAFDSVKRRPEMEKYVYAELVPSFAEKREAALAARSVIRWPEKLHEKTPILILHGSADWRVHPSQALQLVTKLYEIKHPVRFVFFEGGDHGLSEHRLEVDRMARNWLDHYVRDSRPFPDLEPHGR